MMFGKSDKSSPSAASVSQYHQPARSSLALIVLLALASLFVSHQPLGALLLTPVEFLATNLHELGHALFCVLTGIPFIYDQTGYLGCTLFGCLLLYFGRLRQNARAVLMTLGVLVGIGSAFFIVHTFGMANYGQAALYSLGLALGMGGVLIFAGLKLNATLAHYLLLFLAVQISLNALTDVVWLIQISAGMVGAHSFSDATNMAQLTGVPAVVWSIWWGLASIGMIFFTLRLIYRRA